MSKDTALVYWIEADTGHLRCESMSPSDVPGGRTFESEVILKLGRNPQDITTIYLRRAGNDWEKGEVERLRAKSAEMRQAIAAKQLDTGA